MCLRGLGRMVSKVLKGLGLRILSVYSLGFWVLKVFRVSSVQGLGCLGCLVRFVVWVVFSAP